MKIKPLNDWAVIVPSDAGDRTAGGLYIPDSAKEKPAEGVVEAIGPGAFEREEFGKKKKEKKDRKFIPTSVKPGDRVLYERFAGQKIMLGAVERVLVREREILGLFAGASSGSPKPLQLPEKTASAAETSLATIAMKAIMATGKAEHQGPGARGQEPGKAKKQGAVNKKKEQPKAKAKKTAKKNVKKAVKKKGGKKK